jgi:hypothetical protein
LNVVRMRVAMRTFSSGSSRSSRAARPLLFGRASAAHDHAVALEPLQHLPDAFDDKLFVSPLAFGHLVLDGYAPDRAEFDHRVVVQLIGLATV